MLFKQAFNIISNKSHLTLNGVYEIVNIKASMYLGLSDILKLEFTNYLPVKRPLELNKDLILNPYWISGFVSAEGNFDVRVPATKSKLGYRVQLRFRIYQHDIVLLTKIIK